MLCLATATHNFKLEKITDNCLTDIYLLCVNLDV